MSSGLSTVGVSVERSGKPIIHGVDIDIAPGRITALLGANGAGKSSLVLSIVGVLPVARGKITLDGKPINGQRPENVRRLGVVAVPEGHRVLTELTVEENLRVAGTMLSRRDLDDAVEHALAAFPELRPRLAARAGTLSGGQQQMVVLGQAIVSRPRYILADELSFGLAPTVVARLVPVLETLAGEGIGVLLIEQFTHIALRISHHAYVLERGRICFSGTPETLLRDPEILHTAYLAELRN
jgi:branched-chain amino acid transport system ATP-binding protein